MSRALSGSYSVLSLDLAFEMDMEEVAGAVAVEEDSAAAAAAAADVDRRRMWRAEIENDISRV